MNKVLASILENAIKESLVSYESKEDANSLGDLYLCYDSEDNSLIIYDDTNRVLNETRLTENHFFNLVHTLRHVLHQAGRDRLFERNYIIKPFTVSLIDKDFVVMEELFFLDDDELKQNTSSWRSIEKDLDAFLENLLK